MSKLFDLDSPFMNVINKLSDIIIINLVYIFCCLPVFTIGAATTALYYTVYKIIEDAILIYNSKFFLYSHSQHKLVLK